MQLLRCSAQRCILTFLECPTKFYLTSTVKAEEVERETSQLVLRIWDFVVAVLRVDPEVQVFLSVSFQSRTYTCKSGNENGYASAHGDVV